MLSLYLPYEPHNPLLGIFIAAFFMWASKKITKGHEEILEGNRNVLILIIVTFIQLYMSVKTHWMIYLKWVYLILHKLYFKTNF